MKNSQGSSPVDPQAENAALVTPMSRKPVDGRSREVRRTATAFFAAMVLAYAALSPGVFSSMGYVQEELEAGRRVLAQVGLYSPRSGEPVWPRNGVVSVVAHLPFLAVAHLLPGDSELFEDWLLSFEPILFTAGTLTILFLWIWQINGSGRWALLLAWGAGFATLLWPYAYIGLEVQQSFLLMLTAYLVLARRWSPTSGRLLILAVLAGFAISVKTAGTVLIPAVAFLIWKFFDGERKTAPATIAKMVVMIAITGLIYKGNSYLQMLFWDEWGGSSDYLRQWIVRDPVAFYLNVVSFFGSANKGLIVFAPLVIVALFAARTSWKHDRAATTFSLLALVPPLLGFSMLMIWTDENWGPRYLHVAIAPMVLCLGIARRDRAFAPRREIPLIASLLLGCVVSFLGAFFSYGALQYVASQTRQAKLETFQSDLVWNHVRFNARLMSVWLTAREATEVLWTPTHHPWDFSGGAKYDEPLSANLKEVMTPQAALIRQWGKSPAEPGFGQFLFSLVCLLAAPLLFYRVRSSARASDESARLGESG